MQFLIRYACMSHIGKYRAMNQDNFICNGRIALSGDDKTVFPLCGMQTSKNNSVFGIFDGMGGEECGEIAAYIAAKNAAELFIGNNAIEALSAFCTKANSDICDYARTYGISAMGTTAAMLAFTPKKITLCNIGDTKVFRFSAGKLEQISEDHVATSLQVRKPPLLQNLGIDPDEFAIEPYLAQGAYRDGDMYLLCSDGLTDMVEEEEIGKTMQNGDVTAIAKALLQKALDNGGKDNITIILIALEKKKINLFKNINGGDSI